MKEDFVTIEIAKKLKDKGYTGGTNGKYIEKIPGSEREEWNDAEFMYVTVTDVISYPKAHIYDVLKWLREEKKIHVATGVTPKSAWRYVIMFCDERGLQEPTITVKNYPDYPSAAFAGIEYVLDNLI